MINNIINSSQVYFYPSKPNQNHVSEQKEEKQHNMACLSGVPVIPVNKPACLFLAQCMYWLSARSPSHVPQDTRCTLDKAQAQDPAWTTMADDKMAILVIKLIVRYILICFRQEVRSCFKKWLFKKKVFSRNALRAVCFDTFFYYNYK